jgi:hypothetical protein
MDATTGYVALARSVLSRLIPFRKSPPPPSPTIHIDLKVDGKSVRCTTSMKSNRNR